MTSIGIKFCFSVLLIFSVFGASCSSGPEVKSQAYASLKSQRTFEYDFPVVWKGIEAALKNHKVLERDPSEVDVLEMKKLRERTLDTDWAYGQSRDKYIEYKVNDSPQKKYLQVKVKYHIVAKAVMGGVNVSVTQKEQIERLHDDGSSAGWDDMDQADTARANELIEKIGNSILSLAP